MRRSSPRCATASDRARCRSRSGCRAAFTETGTLELWCEPTTPSTAGGCLQPARRRSGSARRREPEDECETTRRVHRRGRGARAARRRCSRAVFGPGSSSDAAGSTDRGARERSSGTASTRGRSRPSARSRTCCCNVEPGAPRAPRHEVRWLNLAGFCARPGFGSALDAWRVSELRKIYAAGLAFPERRQNQVEWLVLWQRVGAGSAPASSASSRSGCRGSSASASASRRAQPADRARSLAAARILERLDAGQRAKLGDELIARIRREPRNASWLWARAASARASRSTAR